MNCPICKNPKCEECADEVDIGVGVQRHVFGYECPDCGQLAVCSTCGVVGNLPHHPVCATITEKETA